MTAAKNGIYLCKSNAIWIVKFEQKRFSSAILFVWKETKRTGSSSVDFKMSKELCVKKKFKLYKNKTFTSL